VSGRAAMCRRADPKPATDSARISAHMSSLWGKVVPSEVVENELGELLGECSYRSAPFGVWASVSRHDPTATPAAGPCSCRPRSAEGRRAHLDG
jgi:hypothetical protein